MCGFRAISSLEPSVHKRSDNLQVEAPGAHVTIGEVHQHHLRALEIRSEQSWGRALPPGARKYRHRLLELLLEHIPP